MDRLVRLQGFLLAALSLLGIRLVHLQLVRGAYYRGLAEQNRLRMVPEPASRGLIVDRHGRILAANQTVFRVALIPQELDDASAVLAKVSALIRRPVKTLEAEFRRERSFAFFPATIVARVPKDLAVQLDEERWRLPGLLVKAEPERSYPLGSTASQLLGYLSQPTEEEMPLLKYYGVHPKELVGRTGLEQQLDHALRGRPGGLLVEVNHRGRQVRVISRRAPAPGAKVVLTIDAPLQCLIERSFGSQAGAAVVLSPSSGEIFAMVSVPGFSPGVFVRQDHEAIQRVLNDAQAPLMNRAAVGVYPPGSIMKLVTASAALENKLVSPSTVIVCPGALTIGDRIFHCWYRDGHGPMTLSEALMQSCNVYFMTLGRMLGAQRLRAAMDAIGFSHRTGWPMDEQPGHLPQRRLTEGDVAQMAIGQGEVLVTVLQVAVMAGAFANRSWLVEPQVVRSIAGRPPVHRSGPRRVGWSPQTMEAVQTGMRAVVADPSGTGHHAFSSAVSIAGKTGTAQTYLPGETHGWFVGFCPVDQPRVAFAIVAEHGGSGGDLPAAIAKGICEYVALAAFLADPVP